MNCFVMKNKNNAFFFSYFYLLFFILFLLMKRICEWCGKPIGVVRHGNQRYHVVNDEGVECYKEHRREVKRDYQSGYYRKHKDIKNLASLGSGYLRQHRKQDFSHELLTVQRELDRLGLKKILSTGNSEEELIQPLRD